MKSIKTQIILVITVIAIVISGMIGTMAYLNARTAVTDEISDAIQLVAAQGVNLVSSEVETQTSVLEALSQNKIILDYLSTGTAIKDEDMAFLKNEAERTGFKVLGISDLSGNALRSAGGMVEISDREYFAIAKEGKPNVSDVLVDKVTEELIVMYAVPVQDNGKITGVLYGVRDARELSDMLKGITIGETGYAYMVNKEGTLTANPTNFDLVASFDNTIENAKENKALAPMAAVTSKMAGGETGIGQYVYDRKDKMMGYAPVPGTNWSLAVTADLSELLTGVDRMRNQILITALIFVGIGIACAWLVAKFLADPIAAMTSVLGRFADYDLTIDENSSAMKHLKRKDEIGRIANALIKMQKAISAVLKQKDEIGRP